MLGDLPRPAEVLAVAAILLVLVSGLLAASATADGGALGPTAQQERAEEIADERDGRRGWVVRLLGR
jgi:hypothetical protein